ncbi:MAG: isoleucine--tRNA ligase [Bacteriovoracaceae bacterium]
MENKSQSQDTEIESHEPFSFVEAELKILKFWKEERIFEKSLNQTKGQKPYIFYDGPPFATGLPHHGHLVASTLKDIVPRYFTMKGRYVSRRFGWDCHGLPIEHEIDKKLGMSAQDAVASLGVKKYNDECRGIVQRYVSEWEKTVSRMGRWVDFENDYKTMDLNFMESVWWVFNEIWNKGLIYQGTKIVPFSTALGTGLSNFEASSNYQDVQDPAITILFKIQGEENFIAAWTTTPWTLPSNLGLCVNEEIDYVLVKDSEKHQSFYMAKERLEAYSKKHKLEVVKEFKGKDLVGKSYEPLFPYFAELRSEGAFKIYADDFVTTTDGTGVVHMAPAFGEDDNRVMKKIGLKTIVCPVDDNGRLTKEVVDFVGQYVKDADKNIIKALKDRHQLFEQSTLVHSYPMCPRSDTPLIYKAIPSWYVNVEKIKPALLESNAQINWVPEHIKEGRFGKWLEGARDWAISRNRVWGTPLPIWKNEESGKFYCFGSRKDLEEKTGAKLHDLHREFVDDLTFSIKGEAGVYKRIPEVLDCWFESGSMPYAQLHYPFENQEVFEKGFPAEYIAEGLDQTRGWFYTLTVLSTALFKKPAFKNVIVNGMVLAGDGKKMSKRLKNYTPPDSLLESFGADALRLFLINSGLVRAEELRFTDDGVKDMVRRTLLPWYNSFKFFMTYAEVDGWKPGKHYKTSTNILDQWVLSKLQTLIKNVNKEMQAYHLYNVVPELLMFIEDLTNWYIRLNRRRFWTEGLGDDKCAAYSTLYTTMKEITTLMAPFTPFLSEYVYLELKKLGELPKESVHLCTYSEHDENKINKTLEDAVDRMQQVILLGRQKRVLSGVKVKTPLKELIVIHKDEKLLSEMKKLSSYIQTELNIKEVSYSQKESDFIKLYAKPNLPVLGKKLGKRMGEFNAHIQKLSSEDLMRLEEKGEIHLHGESFNQTEILMFREAKAGTNALSNRLISIDLDCTLNQDLIDEGFAREVVNRIQKTRKDQNLNVADRINIQFDGSPELITAMEKHSDYIKSETLSANLERESGVQGIAFEVDDFTLTLNIKKV